VASILQARAASVEVNVWNELQFGEFKKFRPQKLEKVHIKALNKKMSLKECLPPQPNNEIPTAVLS